ncbi:MAG: hypothetical protein ABFD64_11360 [Armatimonadota bacterium]
MNMVQQVLIKTTVRVIIVIIVGILIAMYWRVDWDLTRAGRLAFMLSDTAIPVMRESAIENKPLDLRNIWPEASSANYFKFSAHGLNCSVTQQCSKEPNIRIVIGQQPIIVKHVIASPDGLVSIKMRVTWRILY